MAREIEKLDVLTIAAKKKPGLYSDGNGLWLRVSSSGSKSWIFRFTMNKTARSMGLGPLHSLSLANARVRAGVCRAQLLEGVDPIDARKANRLSALAAAAKTKTFRECTDEHIAANESGWRNPKHIQQWRNTLETYAYPVIGDLSVDAVDTGLVLEILEPIWSMKTETASRVRGRIEAVLDSARVRGRREGDNPARWRGHLDKLLPRPSKVKSVKHHTALPFTEINKFVMSIQAQDSTSARTLEFLILTACRTGEVIGAKWDEVDWNETDWTVPPDRTKTGKQHRVPLSERAIEILKLQSEHRLSDYVFPGQGSNRPLSNMAMLQLLKRMNRGDLTAHGFRSTFRDWAAERTAFQNEVVEMALAHTIANKAEAAYRRGELFDKRRKLMTAWANYCLTPAATETDNVRAIGQST